MRPTRKRIPVALAEARRIALAAQGLDRPRPDRRITARDIRRIINRLGLLQLDFVNVLVPAHYQVLFSRLGPYHRLFSTSSFTSIREFTEQWAHEASIVPVRPWPLLRYRRKTHRIRPSWLRSLYERHIRDYVRRLFSRD